MPAVKLDPNKQYFVNIRWLEAEGPAGAKVIVDNATTTPPPAVPPGPTPSCAGFGPPTHVASNSQVFINQMREKDIVSIEFSSAFFGSNGMTGTALGLSVAGESADIQCVVSRCPNDFTSIGPQCSFINRGTRGGFSFNLSDTPNSSVCTLPKNTSKVYVNIRQVKIPGSGAPVPAYNAPFCSTPSSTNCWLPSCPPGENCSFDVNASKQSGNENSGTNPLDQDFSASFTPVDEILGIPVPPVPGGVEEYLYYQGFLPNTWGFSAQDTYNREMSLGLSNIWSAYWNAIPPSTKPYVAPPATGPNDPYWVNQATKLAQDFIIFGGRNPFA